MEGLHSSTSLRVQDSISTIIALFLLFYLFTSSIVSIVIPSILISSKSYGAMVYLALACFLWLMTLVCYSFSAFTGPGQVPAWYRELYGTRSGVDAHRDMPLRPRWCKKCMASKPPRAHHCKSCNRCVLRMDHHCICWITGRSVDKQLRRVLQPWKFHQVSGILLFDAACCLGRHSLCFTGNGLPNDIRSRPACDIYCKRGTESSLGHCHRSTVCKPHQACFAELDNDRGSGIGIC